MTVKKVWLDETEDDCTSCGLCEAICPEVFVVPDKMEVIEDVDLSKYEMQIKEAVDSCPTEVIKFE